MSNYILLVIIIVIVLLAVFVLYKLGKVQKSNILEWLLFAVTEAEKLLGSGTGQLKLHTVYDWFVAKYPVTSKVIPFEIFSAWVDLALDKMKEMLNNASISNYVEGAK